MTSPHVAADMIQPTGLLTVGLYPNLSNAPTSDPSWPATELALLLQGFLADGYARAATIAVPDATHQDACALAWAYHMAYVVVWQRLSANPATAAVEGQVSMTYTSSQIATFEKLSRDSLRDHESFFVLPDGEASGTTIIASTDTSVTY